MTKDQASERIQAVIRKFFANTGRESPVMDENSDLHKDVGLTSDEGVYLVLDLCDEFQFELPKDFNAVVHEDGDRARTFGELTERVLEATSSEQ